MKTFKVYGVKYPLHPTTKVPPVSYAYKNELVDDVPKGKSVGYITMEDSSVIECYKKFNIWIVLLPLLLILIGVGAFFAYLFFCQPKDIVILGNRIQIEEDNLIVTYNGFPSIEDNQLSIQYQNGSYPATILIEGEGIETHTTNVAEDMFVDSIPCKFTTDAGVVEATITIKTATSTQTFPIVVEIPDNLNPSEDTSGLEGYWFGEEVYGAE